MASSAALVWHPPQVQCGYQLHCSSPCVQRQSASPQSSPQACRGICTSSPTFFTTIGVCEAASYTLFPLLLSYPLLCSIFVLFLKYCLGPTITLGGCVGVLQNCLFWYRAAHTSSHKGDPCRPTLPGPDHLYTVKLNNVIFQWTRYCQEISPLELTLVSLFTGSFSVEVKDWMGILIYLSVLELNSTGAFCLSVKIVGKAEYRQGQYLSLASPHSLGKNGNSSY